MLVVRFAHDNVFQRAYFAFQITKTKGIIMKQWLKWVTVAAALALTACGGSKPAEDQAAQGSQPAAEKTYKRRCECRFCTV